MGELNNGAVIQICIQPRTFMTQTEPRTSEERVAAAPILTKSRCANKGDGSSPAPKIIND